MAYLGNTPTQQSFTPAIDYFSGNASTTAFTLSRPVASVAQVQAVIENVPQNPGDAFTVSGNTITFTSAPPSGTNNIYVYYTSPITTVVQPGQGTVAATQIVDGAVTPAKLSTGGPSWDTSGRLAVGTTSTVASSRINVDQTGYSYSLTATNGSRNYGLGIDGSSWVLVDRNVSQYRIVVDSSGRVTTPYQPMFQVTMVSPWSKANGTQTVPFDSESFDIGGNFNTSTFRFTAPVAGKYLFSATVSSNSSSGALSYYGIIFTANGSTFLDGWNRQETSGYMTDSKTMLVDLAANDYVECKLETTLGLTVAAGNSTRFSGFLVG